MRLGFALRSMTLLLAVCSSALASTTWYVDGVNGSDNNDCKTPQTACKTIGHAISLASSGDSLMIAVATYTENLSISFRLKMMGYDAASTIIDGRGIGRVVTISNGASVTLSKLTIRNGVAHGYGAGIYNQGTLTVNNSTISGNHLNLQILHVCVAGGGGINNSGTLTINDSTITGNTAASGAGTACGGGIKNSGALTINNSTITANGAHVSFGSAYGGGIENSGALTINNSTVSGNGVAFMRTGKAYGGGIYGAATLQNSIVANNSSGGNCSGTITSKGYNLSSDNTCDFNSTGDLNNTDPKLGTLGNNGGPTQTIPLLSGSPAIDAGNPNGCNDNNGHLLKTDERGKPRPDREDKTGCDMGAYELQETQGANNFEISDDLGPFCTRGHCVYKGYCEATFVHGQWKTDGLCTSHRFNFCYIQPSKGCPVGKRIIHLTTTSCGGFGSDEIDFARPCSFIGH